MLMVFSQQPKFEIWKTAKTLMSFTGNCLVQWGDTAIQRNTKKKLAFCSSVGFSIVVKSCNI